MITQELELGLDQANKANIDAQKNLKRYQETVRELQQQIDDEQRAREQLNGQLQHAEKRVQILQQEKDELTNGLDQANHIFTFFVVFRAFYLNSYTYKMV